jgi:hypothetical protein
LKVNPWATAAVAVVALTLAGIGAKSLTHKPAVLIATPAATVTPDTLAIQFEDASARWDWAIADDCGRQFADYFLSRLNSLAGPGSKPITPARWTLRLADGAAITSSGPEVAYPDDSPAAAHTRASCAGSGADVTCLVAIENGAPGADTSVAVVANLQFALLDHLRPRTLDAWRQLSALPWDQLTPLITPEGKTWKTACLTVSPD